MALPALRLPHVTRYRALPMAAALAAHVPDPTIDFLVDAGDGSWSDANLVLAGSDITIKLAGGK